MTTQIWSGGGNDGVFLTNANWVSGTAPGNSDTAIIGFGSQAILGAATGLTGIILVVTAGFGGTIGADTPLTFGSIASLTYAGTGAYANIGCAGTVTAASLQHSGGAEFVASSGTWTLITNSSGTLSVPAATVLTALQNVSGPVTIGYNATALTTLTSAGPVTCKRTITTANLKRSVLIHQDNGTTTYTLCTTVNIENGAIYNKQSGGTDVTVNAFPGSTFTIAGTSGGATGVVTVSTLNEWAGSKIKDVTPGLKLTITTRTPVGATGVGDGPG